MSFVPPPSHFGLVISRSAKCLTDNSLFDAQYTTLATPRGIVSYTRQYQAEAAQTHAAGLRYFIGETNSGEQLCSEDICVLPFPDPRPSPAASRWNRGVGGAQRPIISRDSRLTTDRRYLFAVIATCGGGGISPTFGKFRFLLCLPFCLRRISNAY